MAKESLSYNAAVEIDEITAKKINDFWTEDEVVLTYIVNSYRPSGTLYATSAGIYQDIFRQAETKKLKKVINVPLVTDGHIVITMGLVEVDTPDEDYHLKDFEGKVFKNKKTFTLSGKNRFIQELDRPVYSDWELIAETFKFCGYDYFLQRHLHLSRVRINDDLGCFVMHLKNDKLVPGGVIPKHFNFKGKSIFNYLNGGQNKPEVDYEVKFVIRQR